MAGVRSFTELKIWQKARQWSKVIFSDQVWELYERFTGKPRPEMFRKPQVGGDQK